MVVQRGECLRHPCASSLALQLSRSLAMVLMDKLPGSENIFWKRNGMGLKTNQKHILTLAVLLTVRLWQTDRPTKNHRPLAQ